MPRNAKGDKSPSKTYSFRLPHAQATNLDEQIAASRLTDSEFLRAFFLNHRSKVVPKVAPSLEKQRMQFVFNKAGNNLAHIAQVLDAANQAHRLTDRLYVQAIRGLQDIMQYLKAALDHVD
jgi:hypothetical protein